ncbi:hypothetical protein C9374_004431 [Naegleria lovaniensis]|uniref:Uncharacterized protein n=1 Tax=Naegleria lovaniensis TaxID=51637 RepID=A0AA88GQ41_NAELO|nr:uncharacterized protein C9374_004431 [Naegleria lovaniensis]KAG2383094.1 hypothetical protein C9374_004431 [Naegleria lovaniensis]
MKKRKIELSSESHLSSMIHLVKVELEKQNFAAVIDTLEQQFGCDCPKNIVDDTIKEILFPIYSFYVRRILLPQNQHELALRVMKRALRYCRSLDFLWELTNVVDEGDEAHLLKMEENLKDLITKTCDLIEQRYNGQPNSNCNSNDVLSASSPESTFTSWEYALFRSEWLEFKDDKPSFYPSSCHHLLDPIRGFSISISMPSKNPIQKN